MHTVVEREMEMKLVLSPGRSVPVPARLSYRSNDPYAVHMAFHIGSECPVHWTFARELLVEGVFRPTGQGDVRVWPTRVESRDVICMALSSPDGDALLEAPSLALSAWLERTLREVAPGREGEALAIEEGLSTLLRPAPAPGEGRTPHGRHGGPQTQGGAPRRCEKGQGAESGGGVGSGEGGEGAS
ncbi:SsgA family sporulation/cell division regulator [Streptomyces iconiensis]|uniref:SsgA family sporulation/cell division regulator n=1 Tax=Streptomyces iconiensis TaxID=1384038 RepID=A0ABT6ZX71_9ACTN|nr:SsgA family sporulation/cell division regulator [Streptomyces iconiensis]MDJ1133226.1 SsgA family sporulation/cell division regulator [Streptomyces iconiensis]